MHVDPRETRPSPFLADLWAYPNAFPSKHLTIAYYSQQHFLSMEDKACKTLLSRERLALQVQTWWQTDQQATLFE
ncbi:hypothetical protein AX774_g532 [Zancudomyces culisetae]|uniref:Uncharacterized protein n=1 Tax=Zancudomyces culisetae TaxID=1213189 RepID=A0A1R1PY75_ZANCU|nr:hypothetical protein AX774_g532 [Zancudomyces culisetae]|eukprot:OMH85915.1 hypothetical protein AX774_g532 [Zancudomyces culisetae]